MIKQITCIECPKGCKVSVELDGDVIKSIAGFSCPKGEKYARQEIEDPRRIFTSSVLSSGLELKMVPVRTDKPIPKAKLMEAMKAVKKIRVSGQLKIGQVLMPDFIEGGVNLISTRSLG